MALNLPENIIISDNVSNDLEELIKRLQPDKVAILVDENTKAHCLPVIAIKPELIIEIKSGERHKTLQTCQHIWNKLTASSFTRKSLLINLGGGVIGDMGGFAAATFKRGISFINVPTTLLAQVDASIGGKLGIDFDGLKNHIGLFKTPDYILIHTPFLKTLTERELKSGFAEVIKHALIKDQKHWDYLTSVEFHQLDWYKIISHSVQLKNEVVIADPTEKGERKILNFGHTIGHALETHFLNSETSLLHGEAVALGMIMEAHLSLQKEWLSETDFESIKDYILSVFNLPGQLPDFNEWGAFMMQDKKNIGNEVSFSILQGIGKCAYDISVGEDQLTASLKHYNQIKRSS